MCQVGHSQSYCFICFVSPSLCFFSKFLSLCFSHYFLSFHSSFISLYLRFLLCSFISMLIEVWDLAWRCVTMHSLTFLLAFCFRNYIFLVGPTSTANWKRQQRPSFTEYQRCFLTLPFIYSLLINVFFFINVTGLRGKGTLKIRALQGSGTMWHSVLRVSRPLARMTCTRVEAHRYRRTLSWHCSSRGSGL